MLTRGYRPGCYGVLNYDDLPAAPFYLIDGGLERRFDEPYEFQNDRRPGYSGYLFQYTLSGSGVFEYAGTKHSIGENQGFLVSFPEPSCYRLADKPDNEWVILYLHFDGSAVKPFFDRLRHLHHGPLALEKNSKAIQMLIEFNRKMINGHRLSKYEGGEFLCCFLYRLLTDLENPPASLRQQKMPHHNLIADARYIMEHEYHTIESIDRVCRRLNVSTAHFSRVFKAGTGQSPMEYLTARRVEAAMGLLLNTDYTVERIAVLCGFSAGNYFCKVFRRHVGSSPAEYRKRQ